MTGRPMTLNLSMMTGQDLARMTITHTLRTGRRTKGSGLLGLQRIGIRTPVGSLRAGLLPRTLVTTGVSTKATGAPAAGVQPTMTPPTGEKAVLELITGAAPRVSASVAGVMDLGPFAVNATPCTIGHHASETLARLAAATQAEILAVTLAALISDCGAAMPDAMAAVV